MEKFIVKLELNDAFKDNNSGLHFIELNGETVCNKIDDYLEKNLTNLEYIEKN